ncbi:LANO_0G16952g1_1 [Lachancea nothofagi CBS 11611]|uniref:Terpene cyclase/mutase family member n=1 Tax=Lachancea nothofagi CBS 11611 TaxID=1266666 RepID=A0A1G4KKN3_9SACH|nr:LANO_0G16952g1_1 [Lachancea nothofagi CBS 11611]
MVMLYSDELELPKTDHRLWRLRVDSLGSEKWEYLSNADAKSDEQSSYVKQLLGTSGFEEPSPIDDRSAEEHSAYETAFQGARFFSKLQEPESGIFPCQYKGPMFLTVGYVGVHFCAGVPIPEPVRIELVRFIVNSAHPVDGGWGLHEVDKSTAFGTAINYVLLRLLGLPADHIVCKRAQKTLHRLGGALGVPHWGKCWLSILNLYKWEGVNPAPPELWLLPYALPIHPGRWWVHTRAVYQALGYLSSLKFTCQLTPLLQEIRGEIYVKPFDSIDFSKHRNTVCNVDLYYPHTKILNTANSALTFYEKHMRPNWLLRYTNKKCYDLIKKEIENTDYLCIAPVSMAFCALVVLAEEGKDSYQFKRFLEGFKEVLFMGPKGITVMGTNGAQTWDCAFAVQYYFVAGLAEKPEFKSTIESAYKFLCRTQFDTECVPGSFRDKRIGGWPFSTKPQGYTVSDCTAEALKAIIMVKNSPAFSHVKDEISDERLTKGIDVLLSLQNTGSFEYGSFATYEKIRATTALEKLNPAEVFGNIMVEFPYVECTDSSILGLTYFTKYYSYRKNDIENAIDIGIKYIKKAQGEDGSWYGCWGICFTYASMFALEAFSTVNEKYTNSRYVKKACEFLVSKQRADGGWSESMKSSELHTYVEAEKSLVVQTSWALIGLLLADYPDKATIDKGISLLKQRQLASGNWKFEAPEGVFNHSCAIEYASYRFLFPIKALGLYAKKYES